MIHEMWGGKVGKTKQEVTNTHALICIMDGWEGKKEVKKKTQKKNKFGLPWNNTNFSVIVIFFIFLFFSLIGPHAGPNWTEDLCLNISPGPNNLTDICWSIHWIWMLDTALASNLVAG